MAEGQVRDALASVSIGDIDLAVDIPPRKSLIFESAIPTGMITEQLQFGLGIHFLNVRQQEPNPLQRWT